MLQGAQQTHISFSGLPSSFGVVGQPQPAHFLVDLRFLLLDNLSASPTCEIFAKMSAALSQCRI